MYHQQQQQQQQAPGSYGYQQPYYAAASAQQYSAAQPQYSAAQPQYSAQQYLAAQPQYSGAAQLQYSAAQPQYSAQQYLAAQPQYSAPQPTQYTQSNQYAQPQYSASQPMQYAPSQPSYGQPNSYATMQYAQTQPSYATPTPQPVNVQPSNSFAPSSAYGPKSNTIQYAPQPVYAAPAETYPTGATPIHLPTPPMSDPRQSTHALAPRHSNDMNQAMSELSVGPLRTSDGIPSAPSSNPLKKSGGGVVTTVVSGASAGVNRIQNIDEKRVATYPTPKILNNPMMCFDITPQEEVVTIHGVNIYSVHEETFTLLDTNITLSFLRTSIPNVALLRAGKLEILMSVDERPSLRPFRNYYLVAESKFFFAIEVPHDLPEEEVSKIEIMFYYYSRFTRQHGVRPGEETKIETSLAAKPVGFIASAVEGGSKGLGNIFIKAGTGIAKGAHSASDFYCKHRKPYKGPAGLTEKQKAKLEKKSTKTLSGAVETGTEGMVKGTGNVVLGVKKGFQWTGDKISGAANATTKPIKDTEWYKKREEKNEKKKNEEDAKGIKKEGGVMSAVGDVAKSGWNAIQNVKEGVEKGVVTAGTGIRDASVEKNRYRHGDYEAELSKQRWNAVGNVGMSFSNVLSLMKTTATFWMKAAIYTATGVIAYDADLPNKMAGPGWKAGWLMFRRDISLGVGWKSYWAVMRTHLIALYESPADCEKDCEKAADMIKPIKFSSLRRVALETEVSAGKKFAFVVETDKKFFYLSTLCDDIIFPQEVRERDCQAELDSWLSCMATLSEFQLNARIKKEKDRARKLALKKANPEGQPPVPLRPDPSKGKPLPTPPKYEVYNPGHTAPAGPPLKLSSAKGRAIPAPSYEVYNPATAGHSRIL